MNRVEMDATLIERSAVRLTPAGMPVLELRLHHRSETPEAGIARRLDFEVDAVAIGAAAQRLAKVDLGEALHVHGFLAPRGRRSTRLRLHVIEYSRATPAVGPGLACQCGNDKG